MITKSCPQPTKKQNRVHNLPKSKIVATPLAHCGTLISSREQKKGIPAARSVMTPERGNPFISGFFSPLSCVSRQQNYRLDLLSS